MPHVADAPSTSLVSSQVETFDREPLLEVLRRRCGLDFSGYRQATFVRRVQNRMIAVGIKDVRDYRELLELDPSEAEHLVEKLTIKVSRFFRNVATFTLLGECLEPMLLETRGRTLSTWSAGCGRGEEPYTLAMVLAQVGQRSGTPFRVLGTDIDRRALSAARTAKYPERALAQVPNAYKRNCFHWDGREHEVLAELRAHVEFLEHDLATGSTPIADQRFDIVVCRNTLIYFIPSLQVRVQELLRDALLPGGLLVLGESEWLLPEVQSAFAVIDQKNRVFRKLRRLS